MKGKSVAKYVGDCAVKGALGWFLMIAAFEAIYMAECAWRARQDRKYKL
jgi:hypothetical protein